MSTAAYDAFAWFYDRYWNERFHSRAFPVLERILLKDLAPRARVLDVCCGTGYLARMLAARGYRVTGVDASPGMIRYAARSAPGARFHVADAARFRTRARFDAAVSTFDSLNHILQPEALAAALRNVAAVLVPGGAFVFDMLLEDAYREHWHLDGAIVKDEHVLAIAGDGYDPQTRLATCRLALMRKRNGAWRRSDVTITERFYTPKEVDDRLRAAGFGTIQCYDARDLGMDGDIGAGRAWFVAEKPGRMPAPAR